MSLEQMNMVMGEGSGDFELTTTIDNSSVDATVILGTFNFPVYLSRHPGNFRLTIRDVSGDTDYIDDEWANPVEPPWRVQVAEVESGDLFNAGSSAWRSAGPNCVNLGNGSRITFAAGVPGTFQGVYTVRYLVSSSGSENLCPGTTEVFFRRVTLNLTFTG